MAVKIPSTAVLQPDESEGMTETGARTRTISWFDKYDTLKSCIRGIKVGNPYDGGEVLSSSLKQCQSGGILSLTLTIPEKDDSISNESDVKKEIWSLKSCRNDVSILGYCGTEESQPNREWIECWQKEPDAEVARTNNYTKPDGTVSDLSKTNHTAATSELIAKIRRGVESVMRFYPQLTCRQILSGPPDGMLERLGYIDTPKPNSAALQPPDDSGDSEGEEEEKEEPKFGAPKNIGQIIADHQWVCVQDDTDEDQAGDWTRVRSWIGIRRDSSGESVWDEDLYGDDRWPMPYTH